MMNHSPSRRRLLQGLALLGGSSLLPSYVTANLSRADDERALGLELYTLGDAPARDLEGTLREVAKTGYRTVEFPGNYGRSAKQLRQALDAAGLTAPSLMAPLDGAGVKWSLGGDVAQLVDDAKTIGAQYVVVPGPWLPEGLALKELSRDSWKRTADLLNEHGSALKRAGLRLAYHNHAVEFLPLVDKGTGYDVLVENTDPRWVDFEVDIGWVVSAGEDPIKLINRLGPRVKLLHLKDTKAISADPHELIPADVGTGIVPWGKLIPLILRARIPHLYVEQEPPFATSPEAAARVAYTYLSQALREKEG